MYKKFNVCYLHIGTEKTGTSSIQRFFFENQTEIIDQGFLYPALPGKSHSHNEFASAFHDNQSARVGSKNRLKEMQAVLESSPKSRGILISAEHFHSRVTTPERIRNVANFLSSYCQVLRLVVYLRPQLELLESRLSTSLKGGRCPRLPLKLDRMKQASLRYYDYEALLSRWSDVFGEENTVVRVFDRQCLIRGDVRDDICSTIGIESQAFQYPDLENESLSVDAQMLLQAINKKIPPLADRDHKRHWMRIELRRLIQSHRGKSYRLSEDQANEFMSLFDRSNQSVCEKFFPSRDRLFDYPVTAGRPSSLSEQTSYEGLLDVSAEVLFKAILAQKSGKAVE